MTAILHLMHRPLRLLMLAILATFLGGGMASAGQAGNREDRLAAFMERAEEAKARLALTPEQEKQIEPIMEASRDRRLAILERYGFGGGTKPELSLREKLRLAKDMKAVRTDTEKQLARYLTDDQMREYAKIQDENRERMKAALKARRDG